MKRSVGPALAFGAVLVMCGMAPAAHAAEGASAHPHRHHAGRHPAQAVERPKPVAEHQAPPDAEPLIPTIDPFLHPGEGDNDGLSRDPEDCDKGCIGGNPG